MIQSINQWTSSTGLETGCKPVLLTIETRHKSFWYSAEFKFWLSTIGLSTVGASTYADCFCKSLDGESSGIKDLVKVGLSRIVLGILRWRELGILEEEQKD